MSMATSPAARQPVHLRRISCEGYLRDDGLFDIEGLLIDTKPVTLQLVNKAVTAGDPIHQMRVRLTIDRERCILDANVWSEHTPYPDCMEVEASYRKLIGLRIEPGFTRVVKRLFRGTLGCSHMTELLPHMASTAFQVMWADGDFNTVDAKGSQQRTSPLGGCHSLRLDGHIVRTYFPKHQKEPEP